MPGTIPSQLPPTPSSGHLRESVTDVEEFPRSDFDESTSSCVYQPRSAADQGIQLQPRVAPAWKRTNHFVIISMDLSALGGSQVTMKPCIQQPLITPRGLRIETGLIREHGLVMVGPAISFIFPSWCLNLMKPAAPVRHHAQLNDTFKEDQDFV